LEELMAVQNDLLTESLLSDRVLPVLTVRSDEHAEALGAGLLQGGLHGAEVTLRTPFALPAIRRMHEMGLYVGAGTIMSVADAEAARDAGARYLVSPGIVPSVADWSVQNGLPYLPGVASASEIISAEALGCPVVKAFPASVIGGAEWVKAVSAPIPSVKFIATGGITDDVLADYLMIPSLLAVGGSWFLTGTDVDTITRQTQLLVSRVTEVAGRAAA
jgi:2-dehydro-3-deoxyphosphogluconate aldolase/(4S)-4-hydroxy-2-oxoglutarate aldolase